MLRNLMSLFIEIISLYNPINFYVILYPTSLARLRWELGIVTRSYSSDLSVCDQYVIPHLGVIPKILYHDVQCPMNSLLSILAPFHNCGTIIVQNCTCRVPTGLEKSWNLTLDLKSHWILCWPGKMAFCLEKSLKINGSHWKMSCAMLDLIWTLKQWWLYDWKYHFNITFETKLVKPCLQCYLLHSCR